MNRNRRIVVVVLVVGAVAAWLVLADTNHDNADTATGDTIVPNDEMTHSDE
jgi:predicted metal-binding membrane protein